MIYINHEHLINTPYDVIAPAPHELWATKMIVDQQAGLIQV